MQWFLTLIVLFWTPSHSLLVCFRDQWCWRAGLLPGRIQCRLHHGNHLTTFDAIVWGVSFFCFHALNYQSFLSQDGKVVLGGPGSFYWQGTTATLVTEKMWKCIGIHEVHRVLVCFLGQVISAAKEDIIKAYYPGYFMQSVQNQIQTKQGPPKHDDSYQGKRVTVLSLTMHNIALYYFLLFMSLVLLGFHVFALTHRLLCCCWGVHRRSGGR